MVNLAEKPAFDIGTVATGLAVDRHLLLDRREKRIVVELEGFDRDGVLAEIVAHAFSA